MTSTQYRPGIAAGYGGTNRIASTYVGVVRLTVAAVPYDRQASSGVVQPAPSTSHALSVAPATTGRPCGTPVSAAAAAPTSPRIEPVGTSSGSMAGSTARHCHFQSDAAAQRPCR